jgi:PqqD family protein of HPr-rel-A system
LFVGRGEELRWACWEGEYEYSVFDPGTGETHLLNEFPAEILRRLARGPDSVTRLASGLASACGVESDAGWTEQVASTVAALWRLGLIDTLDSSATLDADPGTEGV